jgi:ribosome recycling factor
MQKTVDHFAEQLMGIRYGIPTCGLIDTIKVDYHGQMTPIKHMAQTTPQAGKIAVIPYDPTVLGAVDKALKAAGFNSYVFSKTTVAINLPKFAGGADRDRVIAQVRKLEEEAKVAIRNIRKKVRQELASLPEDELKRAEKELQASTDSYISQIAALAAKKIKEL